MIGTFVTAKLFNKDECRQGYIISMIPFVIQGESGVHYLCCGNPVVVANPPYNKSIDADQKS